MRVTNALARWMFSASLGLAPVVGTALADDTVAAPAPVREIEIVVQDGYQPARVVVTEGEHVKLRFLRKEYTGCTLEVVFPTLGIRRELPTNVPVEIDLGTLPAGEVPFHCGMEMIHGVIAVQSKE